MHDNTSAYRYKLRTYIRELIWANSSCTEYHKHIPYLQSVSHDATALNKTHSVLIKYIFVRKLYNIVQYDYTNNIITNITISIHATSVSVISKYKHYPLDT
jgi:hypothetical protein